MALAYDNATDGSVAAGTSKTVTHTMSASADGVVFAFLMANKTGANGASGITATWDGGAMTEISTQGTSRLLNVWVKIAPSTGAKNCVVSWTNNCDAVVAVVSFTGANQTTPYGTIVLNSATGTTPTVDVPSCAGFITLDGVIIDFVAGDTLAVGADQTQ